MIEVRKEQQKGCMLALLLMAISVVLVLIIIIVELHR